MNYNIKLFINEFKFPILNCLLNDNLDIGIWINDLKFKLCNKVIEDIKWQKRIYNVEELDKIIFDLEHESLFQLNYDIIEYAILDEFSIKYLINSISNQRKNTLFINLSKSQGAIWNPCLIDMYKRELDWYYVTNNPSIQWTQDLIERFEDYIDFKQLSLNTNLIFNEEIVNKYEERWNWCYLSGNPKVALDIESFLLNHPKAIWSTKPIVGYSAFGEPLESLNTIYNPFKFHKNYPINPCISTNGSIHWSIEKYEKYKENIDTWLLALFGNMEYKLIEKLIYTFDENRVSNIERTKHSDWRDRYFVYRNGIYNLCNNEYLDFNLEFIRLLKSVKCNLIGHNGNAMTGHTEYFYKYDAIKFLRGDLINLSIHEFLNNHIYNFIPQLITTSYIDPGLYQKIIKHTILKDNDLIFELFKSFAIGSYSIQNIMKRYEELKIRDNLPQ